MLRPRVLTEGGRHDLIPVMGMIDWKHSTKLQLGEERNRLLPTEVERTKNMAGNMKLTETTIKPGERLGVIVTDANGRSTNMIIEVRVTPQPQESPSAFSIEVYQHTPERCINGCEPIVDVLCVPPEEQAAYNEIRKQNAAERAAEDPARRFAQSIADGLGLEVFTVDETGIHPVSPHPRK
jgi:hypothetical protein